LYGLEQEERTAAIVAGYEKVHSLSVVLEELSEHVTCLSQFMSQTSATFEVPTELLTTIEKTASKSNKKRVSIGPKKTIKPVSTKDIDRQLPQIMDNIYSSLIFKNTQQRIQYYKERDETINQYKEQANEYSHILNETTVTITNDIKQRAAEVQAVFILFEQLFRMRKLKEDKLVQQIKSLESSISQLETENEELHLKEEEILSLKKQLRERDQKLQKLNRYP
jgi:DNA repair exonuclease SbcCD ATPase subunit